MKKYLILMLVLAACSPKQHVKTKREISSDNKRGLYFEDVTDESGIPSDMASSSIIAGDYDNDGRVDIIAKDHLFRNISGKDIAFEDVTVKAGLDKLSGYPVFIDINNDGQLDIITTKGMVFIQKNKVFVNMSQQYGLRLPEKAYTLSFADVNGDGFADLLVGQSENHENNTFSFLPPKFYLNIAGKTFKEDPSRFNLDKYPAYVRGMQWADFDNDSVNEVYFSNYRLKQNFLFKKSGNTYVESAPKYKVQGDFDSKTFYDAHLKKSFGPQYGHTIGSVWADFNNDGNFDLWAANLVHKFVGTTNSGGYDYRGYICDDSKIYKNSGAPDYKFIDVRKQSGIPMKPIGDYSAYKGDELWSQITAADFDNDGLIDTYVSQVYKLNYSYSLLFKNLGNFKFKDVGDKEPIRVYDSYGGIWADFNNDGRMDLIISGRETPESDQKLQIFQNIYTNPKNHYVKIRLVGNASGKNPVGTQVRITTDKGVFLRQFEGVTGTLSQQNDPTLHFGLGNSKVIKSVQVRWNSKKVLNVTGVTMDKTWVVTEQK